MKCPVPPLVPDDHLDLLVTAAARWQLLASQTRSAFAREDLTVSTVDDAGEALRRANLAAARWLTEHGRAAAPAALPGRYRFREVDHVDPVEVIKACHAYEHASQQSPDWEASLARSLVAAICVAATQRIDGYAEAPWIWTRPIVRSGSPIGIARDWRPPLAGVDWIDAHELRSRWTNARLVLVTAAAAGDLPGGLEDRDGVFLLVADESSEEVWSAVRASSPEAVLFWPICRDWLTGALRATPGHNGRRVVAS